MARPKLSQVRRSALAAIRYWPHPRERPPTPQGHYRLGKGREREEKARWAAGLRHPEEKTTITSSTTASE
jgi:hypothetical protein